MRFRFPCALFLAPSARFPLGTPTRPGDNNNNGAKNLQQLDGKYHMLPTGELLIINITQSDVQHTYRCRTYHQLTQEVIVSGNFGRIQLTGNFIIFYLHKRISLVHSLATYVRFILARPFIFRSAYPVTRSLSPAPVPMPLRGVLC